MSDRGERLARRSARGSRARSQGRAAEVLAAFWMMAKGYRILGFRMRLQGVEIDLAVAKGEVVAIVEVKRRRTLQAALDAVTPVQQARLQRAGWVLADRAPPGGCRRSEASASVRLDLLALAPWRLPRHVPDAWSGSLGVQEGGAWR